MRAILSIRLPCPSMPTALAGLPPTALTLLLHSWLLDEEPTSLRSKGSTADDERSQARAACALTALRHSPLHALLARYMRYSPVTSATRPLHVLLSTCHSRRDVRADVTVRALVCANAGALRCDAVG